MVTYLVEVCAMATVIFLFIVGFFMLFEKLEHHLENKKREADNSA